jgi:hypothetical protein
MDGLPAPGLAQVAAEGLAQVGQRLLPLCSQACDLPADGFFNPHPGPLLSILSIPAMTRCGCD